MIEDKLSGDRGIDITPGADGEVQLGIARGPAIGAEVSQVKKIGRTNTSAGIAQISPAHVRMAFAFDEDVSTIVAIALTCEYIEKAA